MRSRSALIIKNLSGARAQTYSARALSAAQLNGAYDLPSSSAQGHKLICLKESPMPIHSKQKQALPKQQRRPAMLWYRVAKTSGTKASYQQRSEKSAAHLLRATAALYEYRQPRCTAIGEKSRETKEENILACRV